MRRTVMQAQAFPEDRDQSPTVRPVSEPSPLSAVSPWLSASISYCTVQPHKLPQVLCGTRQPTAAPGLDLRLEAGLVGRFPCGPRLPWGLSQQQLDDCGGIQPSPVKTATLLIRSNCFRICVKTESLTIKSTVFLHHEDMLVILRRPGLGGVHSESPVS